MSTILHPLRCEVELTTAFQDADPMGVIYHGNYFRFFEEARRELMEMIDYGYLQMQHSGYMWPVIDVRVKYIKPISFHHQIRVLAHLTEWENRLRVEYQIVDANSGARLCRGYTMQVAVGMESQEMCFASPACLVERVEHWHLHGKQKESGNG